MRRILFVANKYPNSVDPNGLVFLQQLIWEMADNGVECTVICPLAINLNPKYINVRHHIVEKTENGNKVNVFFPKFFGLGQSHYIFGKSPVNITTSLFTKSIFRTIERNNIKFDLVYGHFTAPAGVASSRIGKKYNIPSFFAHGESTSWSIDQFGKEKLKEEFKNITGVIAVSKRNKDLLLLNDIVDESKIEIFPNGYRKERFYMIDKKEARAHFGWDNQKFIVGFCGSFDERKGVLRLQEAIDMIDDKNVVFACAGKGKLIPTSNKCILKEPINNDELVYFYNAIDVFCLPTKNEGCCNAIVEAMACGCPIISSDISFNYDILDDSNALLIDPDNVSEIKKSILDINNSKDGIMRMSENSLIKAKNLTLKKRAKKILKYLYEI